MLKAEFDNYVFFKQWFVVYVREKSTRESKNLTWERDRELWYVMKCAVSSLTCPAPLIHPAGVCVWWPGPAQAAPAAQAPGSVSSFREIFSPVAAWRRWSCDWLSWHAAAPPADADIPWLGAVVIHTLDPGPCPCRDGVITISLHANPERLWHERLIILMLYAVSIPKSSGW